MYEKNKSDSILIRYEDLSTQTFEIICSFLGAQDNILIHKENPQRLRVRNKIINYNKLIHQIGDHNGERV
jgi:hypothetical protein